MNPFYPVSNTGAPPTYPMPFKKRKKSRWNDQVNLELVRSMPTDFKTPQQLAGSGDLEGLKSFLEAFGITIKERDENRATLLHHAAATSQLEVMAYLIDSGIELNAADKDGHTALHIAVLQGHVDAAILLLRSGIDDTILNHNSDAALHIVGRSSNAQLFSAFLDHPTIDVVVAGYRNRTPLHVIAEYDNMELCEIMHNSLLIKGKYQKNTGFRLCAHDQDDLTPIHLAARKGSHKVLDFIMNSCKSHGYPPEVVLGFIDEENSTPLHAAIDGGFTKVVEVLLKHGADPVVIRDTQVPPFLLACSQGKLEMIEIILQADNSSSTNAITCQDVYGQTCLHHSARAINSGHVISYLVSKGARVNAMDNKGHTPMMTSVIAGNASGLSALLKQGADILMRDNTGKNVLYHAVVRNRKKIATILLDHPSARDLVVNVDCENNSPIHHALKLGLCAFVTPMIAVIQSDLKNIKDCNGNNYIHLAASGGNSGALSILLEIGECLKLLNETNNYGGTPLHFAASGGHLRSVELLLSHGAMIHKCHTGKTPFMCACLKGYAEVARVLFAAHPFQLKWTDDKGQSPLHLAVSSGDPRTITLLLDLEIPITHNYEQESFFDQLILKNSTKCVAAVIEHDRYQECLDLVSPVHKHPMLSLITEMPELARKVLDRAHSTANVARVNADYWVKFDFKYLRLKSSHSHQHADEEADEVDDEKKPLTMADEKEIMQSHVIRYKGSVAHRSGVSMETNHNAKMSHLRALHAMVKYKRSSLLIHPVTNAYLKSKWRNYGRWIHIALSSVVFFQVLFLFFFTALIPSPSEVQATTDSGVECGNGSNGTIICPEFGGSAHICRFITLGLSGLNLVVWLFIIVQIKYEALHVVKNLYIPVDFLSIFFTVFYLIPTRGLHDAYWEAGAVAVFFSWLSFIMRIQLFDLFGVYVTMFLAITSRVFQVLSIFFLFVISFGLSFYILTGNLTQYSEIGYSFFVNFGHMLGELDYAGFVFEDVENNLRYYWLTYIFVVTMAIIMGIVVMNLLIGLAVGDIEEIRLNAISAKKIKEVTFLTKIDLIMPSRLFKYVEKFSNTQYPNHRISFMRKLWRLIWQVIKGSGSDSNLGDDDDNDTSLSDASIDQRNFEITRLKEKVEELTISQGNIQNTLNQMKEAQESILKLMSADREGTEEATL